MGPQITRTIEDFNNPGNSQIIGEKYFYDQEAIQIAGLKINKVDSYDDAWTVKSRDPLSILVD